MIIGLTGYAGSGKDTAAEVLVRRGWTRLAFADKVKELATHLGWDGSKEGPGRDFLESVGQGVRDTVGEHAWRNVVLRQIFKEQEALRSVVVTDVRYPNEVNALTGSGGRIVRVVRPGYGPQGPSDSLLDDFIPDLELTNDGTVNELRAKIISYVDPPRGYRP